MVYVVHVLYIEPKLQLQHSVESTQNCSNYV